MRWIDRDEEVVRVNLLRWQSHALFRFPTKVVFIVWPFTDGHDGLFFAIAEFPEIKRQCPPSHRSENRDASCADRAPANHTHMFVPGNILLIGTYQKKSRL